MKKKLVSISLIAAIIFVSAAFGAFAASDIKLFVNGKQINTDVIIKDGTSYIPLRAVSEALGAKVDWDGTTRTITITSDVSASESSKPAQSGAKSYPVNISVTNGPMKLKITKVTLDPAYRLSSFSDSEKAILLEVEVENTSDKNVFWSLTTSPLVLNTKEQIEGGFSPDSVGGEFIGKVVKKGVIKYTTKSDLNEIKSLKWQIDSPFDTETYDDLGSEQTIDIVLE